jgi:hypothetical protein
MFVHSTPLRNVFPTSVHFDLAATVSALSLKKSIIKKDCRYNIEWHGIIGPNAREISTSKRTLAGGARASRRCKKAKGKKK